MKQLVQIAASLAVLAICSCTHNAEDREDNELQADSIQTFFDFVEQGSSRIETVTILELPISRLPLDEITDDSISKIDFQELQQYIIDRYNNLDQYILSTSTLFQDGPDIYDVYQKPDSAKSASTKLPLNYMAMSKSNIDRIRRGDKEAWDALGKTIWEQDKLISEVTEGRISVVGYQHPNVVVSILLPNWQAPSFLRLRLREFIDYIPFSYNLLEGYLRLVSDGNLSIINIKNNNMAKKILDRHYYEVLDSIVELTGNSKFKL